MRFIMVKLAEQGLSQNRPATSRELIRRAYFDLIGLPPSPEEVSAFEKDSSVEAFGRVLDPASGVAAIRRALGTALAGFGAVCTKQWLRARWREASGVAVSRLCDQGV
jgi:hypothetical protein